MSNDLIVYRTKEGKWKATVIGAGNIASALAIKSENNLIKEFHIKTTSEVFPYKDELGPEWPGLYNIGNTCFANSAYKLIARSSDFDEVLNQDRSGQIHTSLRNIVNGIRLGKRSALQEEAVNRKVSEMFLDQLTMQSKEPWNNRKQDDSAKLLEAIGNCIFPKSHLIPPPDIEAVIAATTANGRGYVSRGADWSDGKMVYNNKHYLQEWSKIFFADNEIKGLLSIDTIPYLVTTPRNLYVIYGNNLEYISETIQVPIWDYKTEKLLANKTYKAVAISVQCGTTDSGHYFTLINFNKDGWFEHNDSQTHKLSKLPNLMMPR